jgi:hypothetical protein
MVQGKRLMNEFKSGRGGPRNGAGRPPGKTRVKITPAVKPETKAWLNKQILSIGKEIDRLVQAEILRQEGQKKPVEENPYGHLQSG